MNNLDVALAVINDHLIEQERMGKLRRFVGVHGYMTLMLDKIQRWFELQNDEDRMSEVLGLAADGVAALEMALPDLSVNDDAIHQHIALSERDKPRLTPVSLFEDEEAHEEGTI